MKRIFLWAIYVMVICAVYSCSEDEELFTGRELLETDAEAPAEMQQRFNDESHPIKTVLGDIRVNPFKLETMRLAWGNLNNTSIPEPTATRLYIKFSPTSIDDVIALEELDEMLYDYPLEYEVKEMGDFYIRPDYQKGIFPEQYAIVKPGFSFTKVPYEVIDELHIPEFDSELTKEAFGITGNDYDEYARVMYYEPDHDDHGDGDCPGCPPSPTGGGGVDPDYFTTSDCGCTVFNDTRRPGGCVRVEDTQLGWQGVRNVKVIMKDTWFNENEVWTTQEGCFKITRKYSNKAWMWVKFKSNRTTVKGVRGGYVWGYFHAVKDYVGVLYGPFNNISVDYARNVNTGSKAAQYWMASTLNNAVHEFDDYAVQDGIAKPPHNLKMLITNRRTEYAAPMFDKMGFSASYSVLPGWAGMLAPFLLGPFTTSAIVAGAPDIYIGYEAPRSFASDYLKDVMYHELAHASHMNQAGPHFWQDFVAGVIEEGGYGDPTGPYAGMIAISESWAEFIANTYSHRNYGNLTSRVNNETYEEFLEKRIHFWDFLPVGLHHDLLDDVDDAPITIEWNGTEVLVDDIDDRVSGFTIEQMFSTLGGFTKSIGIYKNKLETMYLQNSGNTQEEFDTLFEQY